MTDRVLACRAIQRCLSPGCVINTGWSFDWLDLFRPSTWLRNIACRQIQKYQRRYFGHHSIYDSTHTMIYLGLVHGRDLGFYRDHKTIFEVTTPRARWTSLWDICLEDIRILRYTHSDLDDYDMELLNQAAQQLCGTEYDYGQLLDFLLHDLIGYPKDAFQLFDQGPERKVCSTGVASMFEYRRKKIGDDIVPRLFDIVNLREWKRHGIYRNIDQCLDPDAVPGDDRIRTPIERVTPAHFENSGFFCNEFELVAQFKHGERVR